MREWFCHGKIPKRELVRDYEYCQLSLKKTIICKLDFRLVIKSIKLSQRNARVLDSRNSSIPFITNIHSVTLMHSLAHIHNT